MLVFDYESKHFRSALKLFNNMELSKGIYKDDRAPSKNKHHIADANSVRESKDTGIIINLS